jgi:hypothetical protein
MPDTNDFDGRRVGIQSLNLLRSLDAPLDKEDDSKNSGHGNF